MQMKGIDVSSYQGDIDFEQVKNSGIESGIIPRRFKFTAKSPNSPGAEILTEIILILFFQVHIYRKVKL